MPPAVSVVIPFFDAERTIGHTLESLRRQTLPDLEVVVVDDGSTDRGPDVVERLARTDHRIRLVGGTGRRGVAAALNVGLQHAGAPFVARLDADDEAEPDRLERQLAALTADPALVVCGSQVTYLGRRGRGVLGRVPLGDEEIRRELDDTLHSPFFHPAVTMRRAGLEEVGGYREVFANSEDYDLWLRLRHVGRLLNLEAPLTRYRVSPHGATLSRLREQRRYALLARAAADAPGRSLPELREEIWSGSRDAEVERFVVKEQRAFATLLADLGHPVAAVAHLVRVREDVGTSAAPRLVVGRVRGLVRRGRP